MKNILAITIVIIALGIGSYAMLDVFGRTLKPCPPHCTHALKVADYRGVYHRVTD